MGILSEIGDYIRSLAELAKHAPPDKLAVVVLGSIALGGVVGWYARRFIGRPSPVPGPGSLPEPPQPTSPPDPRVHNLTRLEAALDRNDEELWRFHSSKPPIHLLDRIKASELKVFVFANLKGGVGKTTLTANLAAYLERRGNRVLLIDFDYQGSLSLTVLRAAKRTFTGSHADKILTGIATAVDVAGLTMEPRLPNLSLVPAGYEVSRQEARMLMRWLLKLETEDPRYALARLLAQPEITETFNYVIIDTPPRLTLATVNALCVARYLIIPTIFDELAIANVGGLLNQTHTWFKQDLNPHLSFAGIVGSMTQARELNETELRARKTVEEMAREHWDKMDPTSIARLDLEPWPEDAHVFQHHVPDTTRFLRDAGRDIAYLDERAQNRDTRAIIDRLGQAIVKRVSS